MQFKIKNFKVTAEFETRIFAKQWDAAQFRRELRRLGPGETVAFGMRRTATNPPSAVSA